MPTSYYSQLNEIVELIALTDPKSILDVGIGFGKYGFLAREYLEHWHAKGEYDDWKIRIDGIEVYKKYITPVHDFIYDRVYIGDALDVLPTLEVSYDLVLIIDVLEHFNYQDGMKLLEECKEHARNIIISTPKDTLPQKSLYGNPFEIHISHWTRKHFDKYANKIFVRNEYSLICYIGDNTLRVRKHLIKSNIKKHFPFLKYPYRIIKKIV